MNKLDPRHALIALLVAFFVTPLCVDSQRLCAQESALEKALPIIRQSGDQHALVGALSGSAMQHMQAGRNDLATERIDEAIAICRKTGDAQMLVTPLMVAGQLLGKLSDDAPVKFMTSLLKDQSGNTAVEAQILKTFGNQLLQSGNLVLAIQVFHDFHAKTAELNPESPDTAWALLQYGRACMYGKMYDLGMPALKQAKQLATKIGDLQLASLTDAAIGNAALQSGEYDTAVKLFKAQIETAKASKVPSAIHFAHTGLISALIGSGDMRSAETLAQQSIEATTGIERGTMQSFAAVIAIDRNDQQKAIDYTKAAIKSKSEQIPLLARALVGDQTVMMDTLALAHYYMLLGDTDAAEVNVKRAERGYDKTIAQIEKAAKFGAVSLDASRTGMSVIPAGVSNVRQQIHVANGEFGPALIQSELGRGQAQADAMRKNFGAEMNASSKQKLSIDTIRQLAAKENVTFVEYSLVQPLDALTAGYLRPEHPLDRPTSLYIWVVPPKGEIVFREVKLDHDIARLVDSMRSSVLATAKPAPDLQDQGDKPADGADVKVNQSPDASPSDAAAASAAAISRQTIANANSKNAIDASDNDARQVLYDLLIAPIKSALPADPNAEVVLIPHGPLFAVPFIALQDSDGKDLIDHHTLSSSASIDLYGLSVACRQADKPFNKENILIVGNPEMPAYRFRPDRPAAPLDPLPGSEIEAQAIAQMFGIEPLLGKQASESAVREKMKLARVIHLATHGLLESDNVFNQSYLSAIALAPSEDDNGFMTVREVMKMKLDADLAVLSACDSGRGKITGEGVVGLSRAYLTAGVPTVVVSLWPVSDHATAVLMVNFYKALASGDTKAVALRKATLKNRDRFYEPRLWAPFTIYGVGR